MLRRALRLALTGEMVVVQRRRGTYRTRVSDGTAAGAVRLRVEAMECHKRDISHSQLQHFLAGESVLYFIVVEQSLLCTEFEIPFILLYFLADASARKPYTNAL